MPYLPAPWTLRGQAMATLHLIDIARARPFVPPELKIVPVLPGKTLGVVLMASYSGLSTLAYNELIVAPALTRHRWRLGFWISHIYVNHPDSMEGGRAIWGLPKEMMRPSWTSEMLSYEQPHEQGYSILCSLRARVPRSLWRQPGIAPVFSRVGEQLMAFRASGTGTLGWSRGSLHVPDDSPLVAFALAEKRLILHYQNLHVVVSAPKPVG